MAMKSPPPNFLGCFISMDRHQNLPNFVVPPPLFDRRSDLRLLSRGIGTLPSTPQCVESPGGPCHPPPTGRWAGSAHSNTLASVGVVRCLVCVPGPPAEQTQPPLGALPSELADPPRPTVSCPTNFRTTPMTRNVRPSRLPDHPESPDVRPTSSFPGLPQPGLVCRPGGGSHAVALHTDRCAALPPPVSPQVSG